MKKLLLFLCLIAFSCSSEEEEQGEEMCCDATIQEITDSYDKLYQEILSNPETTEQQRLEAQEEYEIKMRNPCESYKQALANAGAPCSSRV